MNDAPPPLAASVLTPAPGPPALAPVPQPLGRPLAIPPSRPRPPLGLLPALQSLLQVLVVSLFLITFIVQPIRIPSPSMEPTLLVGDLLLLDKAAVASGPGPLLPPAVIARADLIVFHDPVDDPAVHLVKRVIGLPGDRIHLRDGRVFVNGSPLDEPYAVYRPATPNLYRDDFPNLRTVDAGVHPAWWVQMRGLVHEGEITVPPGRYFVLGDNRNDSADSRYWGFVPRAAIVGKPLLVYFSWRQAEPPDPGPLRPPSNARDFARWERMFHVVR